uniref:Thioredoxin domain-containing protein n=1 Tax=Populus trichocarpa TaxID=3694 RepID=U5GVY0_POPTR
MRGNNKALLVRALIFGSHRSSMNSFSRHLHENLISNPSKTSHPSKSLSNFTTKFHFSTPYLQPFQRTLCSSSSSGASNIVLVKSDEELNSGLKNVQGKFISPVIEELSKKYPHATIYKVDIDTEGLQNALASLNIAAVPTLDFYKNGKKETTIVGADVAKLKNTMESLYRED